MSNIRNQTLRTKCSHEEKDNIRKALLLTGEQLSTFIRRSCVFEAQCMIRRFELIEELERRAMK